MGPGALVAAQLASKDIVSNASVVFERFCCVGTVRDIMSFSFSDIAWSLWGGTRSLWGATDSNAWGLE
jgi:hypothetical protein